jgi:hypothetical protein
MRAADSMYIQLQERFEKDNLNMLYAMYFFSPAHLLRDKGVSLPQRP